MVFIALIIAGIYIIVKRDIKVSPKTRLTGIHAILVGVITILFGLFLKPIFDSESLTILLGSFAAFIVAVSVLILIGRKPL